MNYWNFRDMYCQTRSLKLDIYNHQDALAAGINPFDFPTPKYSAAMQTQALVQALENGGYDAAFGGARRDEEKSRAKERVYSFRDRQHQWDPKNQRPELWNLYNSKINKGESIRVFRSQTGPNLMYGFTFTARTFRFRRCTLPDLGLWYSGAAVDRRGRRAIASKSRGKARNANRQVSNARMLSFDRWSREHGSIDPDIIEETLVATRSERLGRLI